MVDPDGERRVVDGTGREVVLPRAPRRIVSLVPSTTETLASLGLGGAVVGRTRYCVHPRPWVDGVPTVGGTKTPDLVRIAALEPDLILANEEENRPAHFPELETVAPLYVARPRDVTSAVEDVRRLGQLTGAEEAADLWESALRPDLEALRAAARPFSYACLVWRSPWMAADDTTYIAGLLGEAGGRNVIGEGASRYPEVSLEELVAADPDVVLLPSEPYAFEPEHADELGPLAERACLLDGERLCWHGTRLAEALPWLTAMDLGARAQRETLGGGAEQGAG